MVEPPPRIAAVIRHVAWVGIVAHAGFVLLFALLGHPRLAAFNVLSVAAWIAAALVNRRGRSTTGMWLLTIEVVAHAVLAVWTLGWASGFQYYLLPLIPFVMFNDRLGSRAVIAISAGVFATLILLRAVAPDGGVEGAVAPVMRYGNLAIPVLALALVSYHFRRASTLAERRMESMAHTDPLTGLLNRRSMEQRLREAAQGFQRTGRPFCVVMNDQYASWTKGPHHGDARCVDCHLPHDTVEKYLAKALNGYHHSKGFTLQDFHEPILIKPRNAEILQSNCLRCHGDLVHDALVAGARGPKPAEVEDGRCVHCHRGVGHGARG